MKKHLISLAMLLCFFCMILGTAAFQASSLETRRDRLMEKRYSHALAALREKNDNKTIMLLERMKQEFTRGMQKLKPDYQVWYRSLSSEQKRQLLYQSGTKRWLQLMQEIQFDAYIQHRLGENAKLRLAYESIQFACDKAAEMKL
ncbi:hypothetical protein [Telluribacter humicola]|uniref:hypothetical protein n=1 Tax=Telluribacter humicola TaxID=1720261 RepID=UPI001A96E6C4|nr:hypothetical protein [Telluribacter humicola]